MMQRRVQASYCRAPNLAVRVLGWQGVASTQLQVLDMQCSCKQQVSFTSLYMQWLCLLKLDCNLTPIPCSLFHFCPNLARLPHHVQLVGQLNDFFMAVHADLSICIQVPIFFSLVVCLASNKKKGPGKLNKNTNFLNGNKHMQGWNPQKPIEQFKMGMTPQFRYLPGSSTPVLSIAVLSTPTLFTGVSSTQFFNSKFIFSLI